MNITLKKSDTWGALASSLCLVHCLATPFLFIAQTSAVCCHGDVPLWWHSIDFIFLVVSFFAVYHSAKTTAKQTIKKALWICWGLLFALVINEKLGWFPLPEFLLYTVALSLVVLHLYNLKFCQCKTPTCCKNNG